jgi:N-methylhydantoinase B
MGLRYVLRVLVPGTVVTARGLERFRFQPWGREGGLPGACGRAILEEPGGRSSPLGKIDVLEVPPGAALVVETAGGGGFGPPWERPAELVLRDVEDGLVSPEQAEECYGVVVREGRVDEGATLARRRLMREHGGPSARFAFGEAREAFERLWPDELQLALNDATSSWPVPIRQYIRAAVAKDAEAHREGGDAVSPEWIARRVAEVAEELRGTVRGVPGQSG